MAKINLNPNQLKAIKSNAKNLLISASAGTGKTFVMVERVIDLIVNQQVPIESFLVVTFAKASAEEMKTRISKALNQHIEDSLFIKKQLKHMTTASISTLHSFSADLIRRYFYAVNIAPKFAIIDETKATLLMTNELSALLDDKYELKDKNFLRLVDLFSVSRKDEGLMNTVLSLYNFSRSLENPKEFLSNSASSNLLNPQVFENILIEKIDRHYNSLKGKLYELSLQMNSDILAKDRAFALDTITQFDDILKEKALEPKLHAINEFQPLAIARASSKFTETDTYLHNKIKDIKASITKINAGYQKLQVLIDGKDNLAVIQQDIMSLCQLTVEFYDRYQQAKTKIDSLDFSDLEHYALQLLDNDDVKQDINDRYKYVFVDEYQDTSRVQEALIQKIAKHNLFMVGDIKQSIYSFRQCDSSIFKNKESLYKQDNDSGELVYLNQNFRSGGKILQFVNLVFGNIMTDELGDNYIENSMFQDYNELGSVDMSLLVVDKDDVEATPLIYSVKEDNYKDDEYIKAEKEGKLIAKKIHSLIGTTINDNGKERPINYSDFCILLRSISSNHADCIYKTLQESGIPTTISNSGASLLDYSEVLQVQNFLTCLLNYKIDVPLLSSLKSPFFNFTDSELLQIRKCSDKKFFHQCLDDVAESTLDETLKAKVASFFYTLKYYRDVAIARGGIHAVTRAIEETSFEFITLSMSYGGEKMRRVRQYLQMITFVDDNHNLPELISNIEKIKDKLVTKDSDSNNDSVTMMSIHKSKGLEFPICIVAGITRPFNKRSTFEKVLMHSKYGLAIKNINTTTRKRVESLPYYAISKVIAEENMQEELRILYVALTRPKVKLIMTGVIPNKDNLLTVDDLGIEPIKSSHDFYEKKNYLEFILGGIIDKPNKIANIELITSDDRRDSMEKLELDLTQTNQTAKDSLLSNLTYKYPHDVDLILPTKFSASNLKRHSYIEEDVVYKVPAKFKENSAEIGIAYHKLLELCPPKADENTIITVLNQAIADNVIKAEYKDNIDISAIKLALSHEFMSYGEHYAEKSFMGYFSAEQFTEYNTKRPVLIQGVIDLIIYNKEKNTAIVVDYKYSNERRADVLKSRYAEQLNIYKYACEHIMNIKVEKCYIVNIKYGYLIEM